jgi:hypothetical protein
MDWVGYRENWRWMSFPPEDDGSEDDGDGNQNEDLHIY